MSALRVTDQAARKTTKILGSAFLLVAVAACSGPVFVEERTGYATESNAVTSIMENLGAIDPTEEQIEYSERPALVMPDQQTVADLPTPITESTSANPQNLVENWPVDPETPIEAIELGRGDVRAAGLQTNDNSAERLLPGNAVTRALPVFNTSGSRPNASRNRQDDEGNPKLNPAEIRQARRQVTDINEATRQLAATGPAERRFLTDPPTRFVTPAETAEFEVPEERRRARPEDKCKQANLSARDYTRCQYRNN